MKRRPYVLLSVIGGNILHWHCVAVSGTGNTDGEGELWITLLANSLNHAFSQESETEKRRASAT